MTGYYSLIQYMPDRSRMEALNVGVLLLVPEMRFLRYRTGFGSGALLDFRLRVHATGYAVPDLDDLILACAEGLNRLPAEVAAVDEFIRTRCNDIVLTPLRPLNTDDPAAELEKLFEKLVL